MAAPLASALQAQAAALRPSVTLCRDGTPASADANARGAGAEANARPSSASPNANATTSTSANAYATTSASVDAGSGSADANANANASTTAKFANANAGTTARADGTSTINADADIRFDPSDPRLLHHLDTYGYAVVRAIPSEEVRAEADSLLWAFLEQHVGWVRGDPGTWTTEAFDESAGMVSWGSERVAVMAHTDSLAALRRTRASCFVKA